MSRAKTTFTRQISHLALLLLFTIHGTGSDTQRSSLNELLQMFATEKTFWQQLEIAKAIIATHDTNVLPSLEPWLTHEDRHLRANAAMIFAALGDRRGFDVIVGILNDRSDRPLGQGIPIAVNHGANISTLQIRADRYYAVHLLGDLKDRRAVPVLVPLLNDPEVSYIVPWSLGQIGDRTAIEPLINTLNSHDPSVRVLAILALQELGADEALPKLRQLLNDEQRCTFDKGQTVADTARLAIAKIRKKTDRN